MYCYKNLVGNKLSILSGISIKIINHCKFKKRHCMGIYIYITKIQRKEKFRSVNLWIRIGKPRQ